MDVPYGYGNSSFKKIDGYLHQQFGEHICCENLAV